MRGTGAHQPVRAAVDAAEAGAGEWRAAVVAQRISDGIARHRFMAGRDLLQIPGVSLGTATFPQDGATAEELLEAADATLYRQKRRAS